ITKDGAFPAGTTTSLSCSAASRSSSLNACGVFPPRTDGRLEPTRPRDRDLVASLSVLPPSQPTSPATRPIRRRLADGIQPRPAPMRLPAVVLASGSLASLVHCQLL